MSNQTGSAAQEELLQKLLVQYGDNYEIHHHATIAGQPVRAFAEYHVTAEKHLFGFESGPKMQGEEANEYVLFVLADALTPDSLPGLLALGQGMERELVRMHQHHGYSLYSIVVLADRVDKSVARTLRRLKHRPRYPHGWGMVRIAVIGPDGDTSLCNGDGKDLSHLLRTRLA